MPADGFIEHLVEDDEQHHQPPVCVACKPAAHCNGKLDAEQGRHNPVQAACRDVARQREHQGVRHEGDGRQDQRHQQCAAVWPHKIHDKQGEEVGVEVAVQHLNEIDGHENQEVAVAQQLAQHGGKGGVRAGLARLLLAAVGPHALVLSNDPFGDDSKGIKGNSHHNNEVDSKISEVGALPENVGKKHRRRANERSSRRI
mmetsp:Transcript_10978/g.27736  ORF Transcript_10978/g.27736 Transcript_10978/m.27736 type:complete len:200 (+) Transcript_10978:535-1134(+)